MIFNPDHNETPWNIEKPEHFNELILWCKVHWHSIFQQIQAWVGFSSLFFLNSLFYQWTLYSLEAVGTLQQHLWSIKGVKICPVFTLSFLKLMLRGFVHAGSLSRTLWCFGNNSQGQLHRNTTCAVTQGSVLRRTPHLGGLHTLFNVLLTLSWNS